MCGSVLFRVCVCPCRNRLLLSPSWVQVELLKRCYKEARAPKVAASLHRLCLLCSSVLPNIAEDCPHLRRAVTVGTGTGPDKKGAAQGDVFHPSTVTTEDVLVLQRFYNALLLYRLTYEEPITVTSAQFGVPLGNLEQLRRTAYSFAGGPHVERMLRSCVCVRA